jgi:hypothetical protein
VPEIAREVEQKAEAKWTAGQRAAIAWFALPPAEREPHSQELLAGRLGVNEKTIRRWKRQPGFWDEVNAIAFEAVKGWAVKLLDAGYLHALKGSYPHWHALMTMANAPVPTQGGSAGKTTQQIAVFVGGDSSLGKSWTVVASSGTGDDPETEEEIQRGGVRPALGQDGTGAPHHNGNGHW